MTKPTEAQVVARDRNWRIYRLRSLWSQAHILTGERQSLTLKLIDDELWKLGAETETARQTRLRREQEIPF